MLKIIDKHLLKIDRIFLITLGSIPAALLRWHLSNDFLCNVSGAAFLGLIFGINSSTRLRLIFATGFCASFTTYSGWLWDLLELIKHGFLFEALGLIATTLIGGFFSLLVGFFIGEKMR